LVETLDFKEIFFARILKEFAHKYFNVPEEELYGEKSETSRRIMQGIGEMFREEVCGSFWIDRTLGGLPPGYNVVVSDTRYVNEAEAIRKLGGVIIKVVRDAASIEYGADHPTETEQDAIVPDATIFNDGTVEDFHRELNATMITLVDLQRGDHG
jgi:hypothetical protein